MAETIQLGNTTGLQISVKLLPPSVQYPSGLGWAALMLAVNGQTVWGADSAMAEPPGLQWPFVDLLHGMARIWPWLTFEEGYPVPMTPDHPGDMMAKARARWEDFPAAQAEAEEDLLYDFRQRHDLSLLLRGVRVDPLWLLKEGRDCLVWSPALQNAVRLRHDEVMQTLTQLGDVFQQALLASPEPRAQTAVVGWQNRHNATRQHYLGIVTGLNDDELRALSGAKTHDPSSEAAFFELCANDENPVEPNELLMAARMTQGYISLQDQRVLLQYIKSVSRAATEKIDTLSASAPQINPSLTPYEQAYALADWLRAELGIEPDAPVFPDQLLASWAIPLKEFELAAPIDAAAVWGEQRGPCILFNRHENSRASTENGYRTTLAHEICHLLVDRENALPVVEVLGGQVARWAEQRANAFAAELLLPRAQAAKSCETAENLLDAAAYLEKHFRVSREVVCNQINNSDFNRHLDDADRRRLNDWKLQIRASRKNH